jgi:hypothetical protein
MGRAITITDLSQVTGYSRHQLRGLLDELPMYKIRSEGARIAKNYSAHDMVLIALCCRLETQHGLKRQSIVAIASEIAQALSRPNRIVKSAKLLLTYNPIQVEYCEQTIEVGDDALVIALEPIFAIVNEHLMPGHRPKQYELNLGLLEVSAVQIDEISNVERSGSKKGREQA